MNGEGTGARLAPETLAVHTWTGRGRAHRTLNAPLYQTSQWEAASLEELAGLFAQDQDRGFYTRFGHPTIRLAEEKLALLEGSEDALLFASGMGAISTSLLAVLRSGDHVVAHRSIFGQTIQLLEHLAQAFGVRVDFVDAANPAEVEAAVTPATRLLYLETPSNPVIDVLDIQALAAIAHRHGALVYVDSTFAGPLVQRPLEHGADLAIHSASKSLAGHADLLAGGVAGGRELAARIRGMRVMCGPSLDPHACWLLLRGMQTLPLRVRAQSETAFALARLLEASPEVETIRYPFLDSHPGCEAARRQMSVGGGMLSFSLRGGMESTRRFVAALEWIPIASSLGSVYTTIEVPEELDFSDDELGDRAASFAMPPGLIRFSVGVESAADIEAEVRRGLHAVAAGRGGASGSPGAGRHPAEAGA
jgi:cystathionine beta-lyase/cystathionine gamma-synthase